ncbi:MAG: hypothetical protein R3244_13060, partial [Thermoanaerobaculia bacterium]|nr:hypothetical protein [Thermoanaerobaculia bacterium]
EGGVEPISQPSCEPSAVTAEAIYEISTPYGCEIVIDMKVENGRCESITVDKLMLERKHTGLKYLRRNCGYIDIFEVEVAEELDAKASETYRLYRRGYCSVSPWIGRTCEYKYTPWVETSIGRRNGAPRPAQHQTRRCSGKRCYD